MPAQPGLAGGQSQDPTSKLDPVVVSCKWQSEGSQPEAGAGWLGVGPPLKVRQNYKVRDFEDGAGLCSPGRWPPSKRRLPETGNMVRELTQAMRLGAAAWERTIYAMMAGKLTEDPYTADQRAAGTSYLEDWVKTRGCAPTPTADDIPQGPRIRLLQAFLRVCGDPDAEALDIFAIGVRLGYRQRMPRTPAVFAAKAKWRLKYDAHNAESEDWAPNYRSARNQMAFLETKVQEDLQSRRMIKTTFGEARLQYGERLLVGAVGVVEEGREKFRLIHDGTHKTLINNRIRTRDHIPGPLVGDIAAEMLDTEADGESQVGIVWDFASAHRVCQVHPVDWGLQACTLTDLRGETPSDSVPLYLNTVGTFGFSTAGHWWGRLAAMLIRACHYFLGHLYMSRLMIFADDGKATIPIKHFREVIPALFGFLVALGLDVKWAKIRGGFQYQWIG